MPAKDLRAYLTRSARTENHGDDSLGAATAAVVVRSPAGFACSLCQSQYRLHKDAQVCLERCCVHYRLRERVHVLASPSGTHYRCSLCSRVRVHKGDALRCFEGCLEAVRHDVSLPQPLGDALDGLRTSGSKEHGRHGNGNGNGLPEAANRPGGRPLRGPLFGRDRSALPGANAGLVGTLPGGGLPAPSVRGLETRVARPVHNPFGDLESDALRSGQGRGSAVRGRVLSADEVARRSQELLFGDMPQGANIEDAEAFEATVQAGRQSQLESPREGEMESTLRLQDFSPDLSHDVSQDLTQDLTHTPIVLNENPTQALTESFDVYAPQPEPQTATSEAQPLKPDGPTTDAHGNVIYREPGQKSFKRADARYVCSACNSKFFTKNEAEKCFTAHPIRPGSDMV